VCYVLIVFVHVWALAGRLQRGRAWMRRVMESRIICVCVAIWITVV
jgi:hypothetical protein